MEEMGARMLPVLRRFDKTLLETAWWKSMPTMMTKNKKAKEE